MTIASTIAALAADARQAARAVAVADTDIRNQVLSTIGDMLIKAEPTLITENQKDLDSARQKGLSAAMIDRLTLSPATVEQMVQGLKEVVDLPDPVGATVRSWTRPNGLEISRVRIPLGVIAMIYESRPNVTVDAAALCLKAGNATVLRGGSEAFYSNRILARIIQDALDTCGLPRKVVQVLPMTDREAVTHLLRQEESIDVVIPRGGESLIRFVVQNAAMPVLKHYKGVCHLFVDRAADMEMGRSIVFNAKVQRPGVCNALETLLVHEKAASEFLPPMLELLDRAGVEIRGCPATCTISDTVVPAVDEDWSAEYLDLTLAVRIVPGMKEAMDHIARYGSNHTEVIVTGDPDRARQFTRQVDASMVGVNASTRFNDGGQLGLGAEIGISTSKLHAYGPMGLEELTTTKFVVIGSGQIRQ